ncbi:unnamed protein product [Urochloa humidicola]
MAFDAQLILATLNEHFAAVDARWDRFLAAHDQRWAKQVIPGDVLGEHRYKAPVITDEIRARSGLTSIEPSATEPTTTSSPSKAIPVVAATTTPFVVPPEGAVVRREELASRAVPTVANTAEILDVEPSDEIRNGFIDIASIDEILSDDCLTPAIIAPNESVVVFPIDAREQLIQYSPVDTKLMAPTTSSSSSSRTPTPEARVAGVDDIISTTPTRCSTRAPTPVFAFVNNTTATSASLAPTQALGGPAAASSIGMHAWLVVPTCSPGPTVLSAEKEVPNDSAIKCSTVCLNQQRSVGAH